MGISTAVDLSAVARVLGIKTEFKDLRGGNIIFLPQRVALIGQGATASTYATTKRAVTSAFEVGTLYGFGSPLHLAARMLQPENGDGLGSVPLTVYPLVDDGSGVASAATITPAGVPTKQATYVVKLGNIRSSEFVIGVGDTVAAMVTAMTAAINAIVEIPMIATDGTTVVNLASKWKGVSANGIYVEVVGSTAAGVTFGVVQPASGAVNPDVDAALAQIGDIWETLLVNCLDVADTVTLGKYETVGEGRWGALVRKPFVVFTGNTEASQVTAITVPDARKTDRTNAQVTAPGSRDLPFSVAARHVARIASRANNNPPRDYASMDASLLTPGTDAEQWTYAQRDAAVKGGSSTIEVKDGVINLSDTITMFHPSGDPLPAYRYVVDIIKLQNVIFNLDLIFAGPEWAGAPLIPDADATVNKSARKPKDARAAVAAMVDSLGLNAILSNPETAKATIQSAISATNPKRLDLALTVQLSGNVNIISVDLNFGFYFGTDPLV